MRNACCRTLLPNIFMAAWYTRPMSLRNTIAAGLPPRLRAQLIEWEFALHKRLRDLGWHETLRPVFLRRYLQRPEEIDIEVTSLCDADCIMCPRRAMKRK